LFEYDRPLISFFQISHLVVPPPSEVGQANLTVLSIINVSVGLYLLFVDSSIAFNSINQSINHMSCHVIDLTTNQLCKYPYDQTDDTDIGVGCVGFVLVSKSKWKQ
jgi:hypothetical protein